MVAITDALMQQLALQLTSEVSQASLKEQEILLLATLTAPFFEPTKKRAPIQLCAVLDRSGSMSGEKMKCVVEATEFIAKQLTPDDMMSIVSYAEHAAVVAPMLKMDKDNKKVLLDGLSKVKAGGSTDIFRGLHEGLGTLRSDVGSDVITTTLLLTDGQATNGPTTAEGILSTLRDPRQYQSFPTFSFFGSPVTSDAPLPPREILGTINTFGFGSDHDATMLTQLAKQGDGGYYYVPGSDEIGPIFAACLGGVTTVFAQKVRVKFEGLGGVKISRVHTRYNQRRGKDNSSTEIDIPDIQSEEHKDIVLRVSLPTVQTEGRFPVLRVTVVYNNTLSGGEETVVEEISVDRAQEPREEVRPARLDLEHNRIVAAEHMETAVKHGDRGDLDIAMASIMNAMKIIQTSPTAKHPTSEGLLKELQESTASLRSQSAYRNGGQQMLSNGNNAHWNQRVQSTVSPVQQGYTTQSKSIQMQQWSTK